MRRLAATPRSDWQSRVEAQGMTFHTLDDGSPYWNESVFYEFEGREVDAIEKATYALNEICLAAVEQVFQRSLLRQFGVPDAFAGWLEKSWNTDEITIYGRYDLLYDGQSPPKMVEFNADTPTALLEASVIQWHWLEDTQPRGDQFNSIHERLIEAWQRLKPTLNGTLYFSAMEDHLEDTMTAAYLRDTAMQADIITESLSIERIGWNAARHQFVDDHQRPIGHIFKLYPWEWMLREQYGPYLPQAGTRWLEPPWKMLLSCKAILPLLWEMYPNHPNLLSADWKPLPGVCVEKPVHGREGANIRILDDGKPRFATEGPYAGGATIFQEFFPTPRLDDHSSVIGSWLVNGYACGMGIREDSGLVTGNTSRFVPHVLA